MLTDGYNLPAKFVIHAVGPRWQGGTHGEPGLLASCYVNSMRLAKENGCKSVAFPLISAGIFGYPKADAMRVAVKSIREFPGSGEMDVTIALLGDEMMTLAREISPELVK